MKRLKNYLKTTCLYYPLSISKNLFSNCFFVFIYFLLYPLKPKKNKIVFCSFWGQQFNAQPKMIFDELISRNIPNLDIVWILTDGIAEPNEFRTVKPHSIKALYELSTAKVWIDNARKEFWIKKKKKQFYIQTWHGPVCLKAVEKDTQKSLFPVYIASAKRDSINADYLVAETKWRYNNIKTAFWYNGKIIKGEFKKKEISDIAVAAQKVRNHYDIKDDEQIILYVPTFRNSENLNCYSLDYTKVLNALNESSNKKYKFIVRLHPNISKLKNNLQYTDDVLNGTDYQSVDELMAAADMVISDYSGCIFEGYRAQKTVIIFATDIDTYISNDRKLYFDLYNLPSPVAKSNSELVDIINSFDYVDYESKRKQFVDSLGYYEADASKLVVDEIIKRIG